MLPIETTNDLAVAQTHQQKILLVQMADMGDLILTTPAIAALRTALPDAHLTLLASEKAIPAIEKGLVNEIIALQRRSMNHSFAFLLPNNWQLFQTLRANNYDTVIFFHHFTLKAGTLKFWAIAKATNAQRIIGVDNGNGWFLTERIPDSGFGSVHQAQLWLNLVQLLGAEPTPQRARIAFHDGVLPLTVNRGRRVIIHAGGGGYSLARRWSAQKFAQVADALHEQFEAQIVLVGTESDGADEVAEAMKYPVVNLTGKTNITQLADILRSADLFIGADSGVLHLAAGVRTPVIAIYGPSNHEAWSPWSPSGSVAVVRSAPECSPCTYVGHEIGLRDGCPARTCLKMVMPEQVITIAGQLLNDEPVASFTGYPWDARSGRDWNQRIQILGLPVDNINYPEWLALIDHWVQSGNRAHHVCTTNPEFMMIARGDVLFKNILKRADLCLPDGAGLLWAANLLKTPLKERVTGSDGLVRIAQEASVKGWKLFLLGAAEGIAHETAIILQSRFPNLQIVGTFSGSPSPEDEDAIVERVNNSGADILMVAYGAPKQDKWIARNLPRLRVKMAMGVGGSFDFIVGKIPRAPQWMQDYGLEWLYRLYREPWRIWRMMRLPRFVVAVILRGAQE